LVDVTCESFGFFDACAFDIKAAFPLEQAGAGAGGGEVDSGLVVAQREGAVNEVDNLVAEGFDFGYSLLFIFF
jgi:hypothetical protein